MASTPAESAKGKRFSRRNLITHETEYGPVILERIDWRAIFCRSSIEAARARAIRVLSAYGAPLDDLLAVAPHGSTVREYVMHVRGEEPDSLPALAAQLLEVALHLLAYLDMGEEAAKAVPGLAFRLGRLELLLHVYEVEAEIQAARRLGKPTSDRYDVSRNDRVIRHHARLIAAGRTDATKQTALEFDISDRQVRNILKQKAGSNPVHSDSA